MMNSLERFLMTVSCRDSDPIPKVPDGGRICTVDGVPLQIMHDGSKVVAGGYLGDWMADIIRSLRGHHEPQEELIFHHMLRYVRERSTFVELGSWWAYYTAWYLGAVPFSRALCVEPDANHLSIGQENLRLNGHQARFVNAAVGERYSPSVDFVRESDRANVQVPCLDMDATLEAAGTDCIEVLHMDVQGAELPFIRSMPKAVSAGRVRFIVASTHHETISGSPTTHQDCLREITSMGGHILCEHSVDESFSGDGLIVASFFPCDRVLDFPPISRNRADTSLFRSHAQPKSQETRAQGLEHQLELAEARLQEHQLSLAVEAARAAECRAQDAANRTHALENQLRRMSMSVAAAEDSVRRAQNAAHAAQVRADKFKARSSARKAQIKRIKASMSWKVTWPVRQTARLLRKVTRGSGKSPLQGFTAHSHVDAPPPAAGPATGNVISPIHLSAEATLVYRDLVAAIKGSRGKT